MYGIRAYVAIPRVTRPDLYCRTISLVISWSMVWRSPGRKLSRLPRQQMMRSSTKAMTRRTERKDELGSNFGDRTGRL